MKSIQVAVHEAQGAPPLATYDLPADEALAFFARVRGHRDATRAQPAIGSTAFQLPGLLVPKGKPTPASSGRGPYKYTFDLVLSAEANVPDHLEPGEVALKLVRGNLREKELDALGEALIKVSGFNGGGNPQVTAEDVTGGMLVRVVPWTPM